MMSIVAVFTHGKQEWWINGRKMISYKEILPSRPENHSNDDDPCGICREAIWLPAKVVQSYEDQVYENMYCEECIASWFGTGSKINPRTNIKMDNVAFERMWGIIPPKEILPLRPKNHSNDDDPCVICREGIWLPAKVVQSYGGRDYVNMYCEACIMSWFKTGSKINPGTNIKMDNQKFERMWRLDEGGNVVNI